MLEINKRAKSFWELFEGLQEAHGSFVIKGKSESGKTSGEALTKREPVTEALWRSHLEGTDPAAAIGIVPINKSNQCRWGVIDIDDYPIDHTGLYRKIKYAGLPLYVFKSKSGGAHLFLFLDKFLAAGEVQDMLRSYWSKLNIHQCEIFPKQRVIAFESGDMGNWLNMPYFGETRRCINEAGAELTQDEFLAFVKPLPTLELKAKGPSLADSPIIDGPPCLQQLSLDGFPEGSRNNGLYNLGVYLKKADPHNWRKRLPRLNQELFRPPLPFDEVNNIAGSLDKKEYSYTCDQLPISALCKETLCRKRRYGIGSGNGGLPIIHSATKIELPDGGSTYWVELEHPSTGQPQRVQLTVEEHLGASPEKLNFLFINAMDTVISAKPAQWLAWRSRLIAEGSRNKVLVPFEDTEPGRFKELLQKFINDNRESTRVDFPDNGCYLDSEKDLIFLRVPNIVMYMDRAGHPYKTTEKVLGQLKGRYGAQECKIDGMAAKKISPNTVDITMPIQQLTESKTGGEI